MASTQTLRDDLHIPLSSLRLFVSPLCLMSASMWQVAQQRNVQQYGKLEEFVTLVTGSVPELLTFSQRSQLILGLRARLILELCQSEDSIDIETIRHHLDRIHMCTETFKRKENKGVDVEESKAHFVELVQTLLEDPTEREHFFKEVFPVHYNLRYDTALQTLVWEFFSRLEELLPAPRFSQAASLPSIIESDLEEWEEPFADLEPLMTLLQHQRSKGQLGESHFSFNSDTILATLSLVHHEYTVKTVDKGVGGSRDVKSEGEYKGTEEWIEVINWADVKEEMDEVSDDEDYHRRLIEAEGSPPQASAQAPSVADNREAGDVDGPFFTCPHYFCQKTFKRRGDMKRHCKDVHTENGRVPCNQCDKTFKGESSLKYHQRVKHLKKNEAPKVSIGTLCQTTVERKLDLNSHDEEVHTEVERLSCSQCDKTFKGKASLKNHERVQHLRKNLAPNVAICTLCQKTFETQRDLNIHQKEVHMSHEVKRFLCNRCDKTFATKGSLDNHVRIQHLKIYEANSTCTLCQKSFKRRGDLKRHLKEVHTEVERLPCDQCDKSFKTKSSLKNHKRVHTGELPYVCSHCCRGFNSAETLKSHEHTHTGERPFACTLCDKKFRQSTSLRTHLRIHAGDKPHLCSVCGMSFVASGGLLVHSRVHTGERPYQCELCGKGFSTSQSLKLHQRFHTGERPYPCKHCKKRFVSVSALTNHIRTHTGEKPYQCPKCGKGFTERGNMKIHLRSHKS